MQRGGQAARTGRRVISQGWGFFQGAWAGGPTAVHYGTYQVRTSARPFLSLPLLPTRYRLTATSPLQIGDRAVSAPTPQSCCAHPKHAHPEVKLMARQAEVFSDQHRGTTGRHPHDHIEPIQDVAGPWPSRGQIHHASCNTWP